MGGRGSGNYSKAKHKDVESILAKSIYLVESCLDDENIPIDRRLEIASRFALKYMPEKIEIDGAKELPDFIGNFLIPILIQKNNLLKPQDLIPHAQDQ